LLAYEEYYNELMEGFNKKQAELKADYSARMDEIKVKSAMQSKLSAMLEAGKGEMNLAPANAPALQRSPSEEKAVKSAEALASEYQERSSKVADQMRHSVKLLVDSYDGYMRNVPSSPFLLPVKVSLLIPEKKIRVEASLKSTDSLLDLRQILIERSLAVGNPISELGSDLVFRIRQPFGGGKSDQAAVAASDVESLTAYRDEKLTVAELKVKQASEIIVTGSIKLKSEEALKCFSAVFEKDNAAQKMDYFRCDTCKLNWLCQPCATSCHRDHTCVPFLTQHRPSYGCCYCAKSRRCVLANARSVSKART